MKNDSFMNKEMTRWGIGPKFALISVIYGTIILIVHFVYFSSLTFTIISKSVNIVLGITLIILGIPIFLIPAFTIDKYFYRGKLCTTEVYSILRHPIYGAWISFIVPGIVLIVGSIIGISVPLFMYIIFRILIVEEEKYLEKKFGREYLEYKKKVGAIFPKLNWAGIKRRIYVGHFDNPLARLFETLLLGDCRSAFLNEFSRIIRGNEVVLDVGAGTGRFSLAMAKKLSTGKVICLDLSEEMLQILERKAEKEGLKDKIQLLKGEASSSGLKNESVDLVVSNNVFHELSSPKTVLAEMIRVLKPNGWIIITDFRDTRISKLICRPHSEDAHGPFRVNELETILSEAGLSKVKVKPIRHWIIGIGNLSEQKNL
jgi:protein-S-isoprenylcysteine O-methyltransferase Ste14/SAM-dependent methyltransferase